MNRRFHPEASDEAQEQSLYYEEQRSRLGREFFNELKIAVQNIENEPERYQKLTCGVQVYRMKRFPFHLYYRHHPERELVVIYAVAHTKRRPGYWRQRLEWEGE